MTPLPAPARARTTLRFGQRYAVRLPIAALLLVELAAVPVLFDPFAALHEYVPWDRLLRTLARPFAAIVRQALPLAERLHRPASDGTTLAFVILLIALCWALLALATGLAFDFARVRPENGRQRPWRRTAAALLPGIPAYFACGTLHICMDGHMRHPPYPLWHYAMDLLWVGCFLFAALEAYSSSIRWPRTWCWLLLLLVVWRLPLGSLGGTTFLLELPTLIVLGVLASLELVRATPTVDDRPVA